jgi:ABC-type dipeptide/oligopeptide/nickel transport system permease component
MKPFLRLALKAIAAHIILFGGSILIAYSFEHLANLLPKSVAFVIYAVLALIVVGAFVQLHYQISKEAANSRIAKIGAVLSGSLPGWMFLMMLVLTTLPMINQP